MLNEERERQSGKSDKSLNASKSLVSGGNSAQGHSLNDSELVRSFADGKNSGGNSVQGSSLNPKKSQSSSRSGNDS